MFVLLVYYVICPEPFGFLEHCDTMIITIKKTQLGSFKPCFPQECQHSLGIMKATYCLGLCPSCWVRPIELNLKPTV